MTSTAEVTHQDPFNNRHERQVFHDYAYRNDSLRELDRLAEDDMTKLAGMVGVYDGKDAIDPPVSPDFDRARVIRHAEGDRPLHSPVEELNVGEQEEVEDLSEFTEWYNLLSRDERREYGKTLRAERLQRDAIKTRNVLIGLAAVSGVIYTASKLGIPLEDPVLYGK